MSERPIKLILQDIIEAIEKISGYTRGMSEEQFRSNQLVKDAVIRNLEIIGEAANRLPDDFFTKHHEIEWHKIISMRNRLIHGYFDVNDQIVWLTVSNFILPLKIHLIEIINKNSSD